MTIQLTQKNIKQGQTLKPFRVQMRGDVIGQAEVMAVSMKAAFKVASEHFDGAYMCGWDQKDRFFQGYVTYRNSVVFTVKPTKTKRAEKRAPRRRQIKPLPIDVRNSTPDVKMFPDLIDTKPVVEEEDDDWGRVREIVIGGRRTFI